jgi:hypothetical protein
MTLPIATEDVEQMRFVAWLELMGYKFTAIPNSTYTKSWKQKMHNRVVGLRAGFPDLVIIAGGKFMCVEMKRTKNSTTSPAQKEWVEALKNAGIPVIIAKGCDEAIEFVKSIVLSR